MDALEGLSKMTIQGWSINTQDVRSPGTLSLDSFGILQSEHQNNKEGYNE